MRKINKLIIHSTATPEGRHVTVDDIRQWHLTRGFKDIGYHFVIYLDGSEHKGRPIEQIGAHCKGQNADSIGIAYVGGCDIDLMPKNTLNEAQIKQLVKHIKQFKDIYPDAKVKGHNDFANTACPSFRVGEFLEENGII